MEQITKIGVDIQTLYSVVGEFMKLTTAEMDKTPIEILEDSYISALLLQNVRPVSATNVTT